MNKIFYGESVTVWAGAAVFGSIVELTVSGVAIKNNRYVFWEAYLQNCQCVVSVISPQTGRLGVINGATCALGLEVAHAIETLA